MSLRESLAIQLRRAIEVDDLESAEVIATRLSVLIGDVIENDRAPDPIPDWECDAE